MPPRQRLQGGSGIDPVAFRPAAAPVDTYVRPREGKLGQLAAGLSAFAPGLARYSEVLTEQRGEREQREGEERARALYTSGKTYREAIAEGHIRPDQSPFFRMGAQVFYGASAGDKFDADFSLALAKAPEVSESTDPRRFEDFAREFRTSWIAENIGAENAVGEFGQAFGRRADLSTSNHRRQFVAGAGERMQRDVGNALHQTAYSAVLRAHAAGEGEEQAAALLQRTLAQALATGVPPERAHKAVADAVRNAALRVDDAGLLGVLDRIVTDPATGATLGATAHAAEQREAAENAIAAQLQNRWTSDKQRQAQEREEQSRQIVADVVRELATAQSPADVDIAAAAARLAPLDPGGAAQLFNLRATVLAGRNDTDPERVDRALAAVWSGQLSRGGIVRLLTAGEVDAAGASRLMSELEQLEAARRARSGAKAGPDAGEAALSAPAFRSTQRTFFDLFGSEADLTEERAQRRHLANAELSRSWVQFYDSGGKTAGHAAQNEFLRLETERLRRTYGDPGADVSAVPGNPLGIDWRRQPAVQSRAILDNMERTLRAGRNLPPSMVQKLLRMGVTGRELPEFIQRQREILQPTQKRRR